MEKTSLSVSEAARLMGKSNDFIRIGLLNYVFTHYNISIHALREESDSKNAQKSIHINNN